MKLPHIDHARIHLYLTWLWVLLIVPTVLWWRESVFWVALLSIYANVVGHWSSYEAATAAKKMDDKPEGSDDE